MVSNVSWWHQVLRVTSWKTMSSWKETGGVGAWAIRAHTEAPGHLGGGYLVTGRHRNLVDLSQKCSKLKDTESPGKHSVSPANTHLTHRMELSWPWGESGKKIRLCHINLRISQLDEWVAGHGAWWRNRMLRCRKYKHRNAVCMCELPTVGLC